MNMPPIKPGERIQAGIDKTREFVSYVREKLEELSELDEVNVREFDGEKFEQIDHKGGVILIQYQPKEHLGPRFGVASGFGPHGFIDIRNDLPEDVTRFVRMHELFHVLDDSNAGGELGRELRANLIPGIKDPKGLLAAVKATLTNRERIAFYMDRIRQGWRRKRAEKNISSKNPE